jgi:hypothetical protein
MELDPASAETSDELAIAGCTEVKGVLAAVVEEGKASTVAGSVSSDESPPRFPAVETLGGGVRGGLVSGLGKLSHRSFGGGLLFGGNGSISFSGELSRSGRAGGAPSFGESAAQVGAVVFCEDPSVLTLGAGEFSPFRSVPR